MRDAIASRSRGTVKWIALERGHGYVTDASDIDHYFRVTDVRGAKLPARGSIVEFEPSSNAHGPTAKAIVIVSTPEVMPRDDGRVQCPHCGLRVHMRMIVHNREAHHSVCTRCGRVIIDYTASGVLFFWMQVTAMQVGDALRQGVRSVGRFLRGG